MPLHRLKAFSLTVALGAAGVSGAIPEAAHPDFTVAQIPLAGTYKTMGIAFLKDGRMALAVTEFVGWGEVPPASNQHKVLLVEGPGTAAPKVTEIAHTWLQPAGLVVAGDKLYVSDRDGFYEILELAAPADPAKNRRLVVKWPDEGTWNQGGFQWHQWAFTPLYHQGFFYSPYAGCIREGGASAANPTSKMAGALLKWDLSGKLEAVAGGLRVPNGAGLDEATGEIFVADNQGSWLPGSTFARIRPGRFYGHSNVSPTTRANWAETLPYDPPVAWLPYKNPRVSPTQPIQVRQGVYAGDWLLGDIASPGLLRIATDKAGDEYNGAVFWFSQGFRNAAINRLAWGPDGALYVGTLLTIASNWPGGSKQPLFRMAPKAASAAFEMKAVRSIKDGLEVEFTQPVDPSTALKANFTARQWQYIRQVGYGTGKQPDQPLTVAEAVLSADGRRIFLKMAGLVRDRVVYVKHTGLKSASGTDSWNDEVWFTHNTVSAREWNPATTALRPPAPAVSRFAKGVSYRLAAGGVVAVSLDVQGAWKASLVSPDGSVEASESGRGSARFQLTPGRARTGLYLLRVALEDGVVVRKLTL